MAEDPPVSAAGSSADVPGLKAALATLERDYWKRPEGPPPSTFSKFVQKTSALVARGLYSTLGRLGEASLVMRNPSVLLTNVPFVQNLRLRLALDQLSTVPDGAALAAVAKDGISLSMSNELTVGGFATPAAVVVNNGVETSVPGKVVANGFETQGNLVVTLAHELQHQRQMKAGLVDPYAAGKMPSPVEAVWYNRAIEADAQATAVDVAWKLKEAGKPAAWEHVRYEDHVFTRMAEKYENLAGADPGAVTDGRAKRAAYDQWFEEKTSFGNTLSQMYNSFGMNHVPFARDAAAMAERGVPVAPLTAGDFEKLGGLSGGVNYLAAPGGRPLDDPYYRKPDWSMFEAGFLSARHEEYDQIRAGNGSKFLQMPALAPLPPGETRPGVMAETAPQKTAPRAVPAARPG